VVPKVVCLSASNIEMNRANSASTRTCELVREILVKEKGTFEIEIVTLIDFEMRPCRMCGKCFETGRCARDEAFNQVMDKMASADGLFFVCPHYAPFPSKVMIPLEKLEEIAFLKSCANPDFHYPWYQKPMGIIAHGGQEEKTALTYYKDALLAPLAASFRAVQIDVIVAGTGWPDGIVFGIQSIDLPKDSIFVTIQHDWDAIRQRITPLVLNVAGAVG
jgi:NAD(P)H-dependent FMN reductase